jgi:hypothetical protein
MMDLTKYIRFCEKDSLTGAARVRFPLIHGCAVCGGVRSIQFDDEIITNPKVAAAIALVYEGYLLARNERFATNNHPNYNSADGTGHDGTQPNDWQHIKMRKPCACAVEDTTQ